MHSVDAVFFDAVGTLLFCEPSVAATYRRIARSVGVSMDEATIRRRFRAALSRHGQDALETCESRERARWRSIVNEVFDGAAMDGAAMDGAAMDGAAIDDAAMDDAAMDDAAMDGAQDDRDTVANANRFNMLFDRLWDQFATPEQWRVFEDVDPSWTEMASLGVAVGIASNFDHRLESVCGGLPPLNQTNLVFHSAEVGFAKPSVRFFERIAERAGFAPTRCLMVGDDLANDVLAARRAGWRSVQVDRAASRDLLSSDRIGTLAVLRRWIEQFG